MFTTLPIFDRFEFLEYFKIDIQFLVKENSWNWNLLIFFLEFLQIILGIRAMVYQICLNLYLHNSDPNQINRSQDRLGTRAPRPRSQPYLGDPIRRHLSIREKNDLAIFTRTTSESPSLQADPTENAEAPALTTAGVFGMTRTTRDLEGRSWNFIYPLLERISYKLFFQIRISCSFKRKGFHISSN